MFLNSAATLMLGALSAASLVFTSPSPFLSDIHDTIVKVDASQPEVAGSYGHFAIQVLRLDKLYDIDERTADVESLGAKLTQVRINFDVTPKGEVQVDGQPVGVGFSHIETKAMVAYLLKKDNSLELDDAETKEAFYPGVVGVDVHVSGETIDRGGEDFTKIVIGEQITQVDGCMVSQKKLVQQIFTISPRGEVEPEAPCEAPEDRVKYFEAAKQDAAASDDDSDDTLEQDDDNLDADEDDDDDDDFTDGTEDSSAVNTDRLASGALEENVEQPNTESHAPCAGRLRSWYRGLSRKGRCAVKFAAAFSSLSILSLLAFIIARRRSRKNRMEAVPTEDEIDEKAQMAYVKAGSYQPLSAVSEPELPAYTANTEYIPVNQEKE